MPPEQLLEWMKNAAMAREIGTPLMEVLAVPASILIRERRAINPIYATTRDILDLVEYVEKLKCNQI